MAHGYESWWPTRIDGGFLFQEPLGVCPLAHRTEVPWRKKGAGTVTYPERQPGARGMFSEATDAPRLRDKGKGVAGHNTTIQEMMMGNGLAHAGGWLGSSSTRGDGLVDVTLLFRAWQAGARLGGLEGVGEWLQEGGWGLVSRSLGRT
ncbi:hypothetical protein Salat_1434700 [Sesamum alatum]|uniref:Uncharacterized protein n=1 Tax=Sesamum alatum TaxID=300844 RepID=A0AAE1YAR5_9LAMI|nr:hypothetical protein Salat_1434700 [Sesamum alatum]